MGHCMASVGPEIGLRWASYGPFSFSPSLFHLLQIPCARALLSQILMAEASTLYLSPFSSLPSISRSRESNSSVFSPLKFSTISRPPRPSCFPTLHRQKPRTTRTNLSASFPWSDGDGGQLLLPFAPKFCFVCWVLDTMVAGEFVSIRLMGSISIVFLIYFNIFKKIYIMGSVHICSHHKFFYFFFLVLAFSKMGEKRIFVVR